MGQEGGTGREVEQESGTGREVGQEGGTGREVSAQVLTDPEELRDNLMINPGSTRSRTHAGYFYCSTAHHVRP